MKNVIETSLKIIIFFTERDNDCGKILDVMDYGLSVKRLE
jgi:hypothetical protein